MCICESVCVDDSVRLEHVPGGFGLSISISANFISGTEKEGRELLCVMCL